MPASKTKITLIGCAMARHGVEFIYEGELPSCHSCKVRKACNNLQAGKMYRIMVVREASRHECPVHLGGVCAVEVIESPLVALIGADMAILNSTIQYTAPCTRTDCKIFELCHPEGIVEGAKYVVTEILGNPPDSCERGRILKLVELQSQ